MLMAEASTDQAAGLRRMAQAKPVRVIAVTIGKGGVGKTTVAVNVAAGLADAIAVRGPRPERFVELFEGVEGLVHVSEISHRREEGRTRAHHDPYLAARRRLVHAAALAGRERAVQRRGRRSPPGRGQLGVVLVLEPRIDGPIARASAAPAPFRCIPDVQSTELSLCSSFQIFQGALPEDQYSLRICFSRMVSMHCQNPV